MVFVPFFFSSFCPWGNLCFTLQEGRSRLPRAKKPPGLSQDLGTAYLQLAHGGIFSLSRLGAWRWWMDLYPRCRWEQGRRPE